MARSVADAALCMAAIEGYAASDPRAAPLQAGSTLSPVRLGDLKVGVSTNLGLATLEDGIHATFEKLMSALSPLFERTEGIAPDMSSAPDVFRAIRVLDVYANAHVLAEQDSGKLSDNIRNNLALADTLTAADIAKANAAHSVIFQAFQDLFDTYDILICPATAVSPFAVRDPYPTTINGATVSDYVAWYAMTWALSLIGCPIVALPAARDHKGMPFAIQVIAPRHADAFALSVAAAIESALKDI